MGETAKDTSLRGLREEVGVFADENMIHLSASCAFEQKYGKKVRRSDQTVRVDRQLTHVAFYQQDLR